jgi:hypothetical protein
MVIVVLAQGVVAAYVGSPKRGTLVGGSVGGSVGDLAGDPVATTIDDSSATHPTPAR